MPTNNLSNQNKAIPTYISLFSCAGVGCYGFKMEGFSCIASVELNARRLNVQRYNQKCKYASGYICGDMTAQSTKELVFAEIDRWWITPSVLSSLCARSLCPGISLIIPWTIMFVSIESECIFFLYCFLSFR